MPLKWKWPKYSKIIKNDQNIKQISCTFQHFLTYQTVGIYLKKNIEKPIITKAIQEKAEPPSKPTFAAVLLLTECRGFFLAPLPIPSLL